MTDIIPAASDSAARRGNRSRNDGRRQRVLHAATICLAVIALAALAWTLRFVLLLGFAAVLIAIGFRAVSDRIAGRTGLGPGWSLATAVAAIVGTTLFLLYHFGGQFSSQMQALVLQLPLAWAAFEARVGQPDLDERAIVQLRAALGDGTGALSMAWGFVGGVTGALASLLVALVAGVYLAIQPMRYVAGFMRLIPVAMHDRLLPAAGALGAALRLWLVGQLAAMTLVGVLAGAGLWLIGIPSALALGLIAGLLEFVPLVGPIASAIPAILLAMLAGWEQAMMVAGQYFAIQQFEGYVITPLVQQRAVDLPPALNPVFSLGSRQGARRAWCPARGAADGCHLRRSESAVSARAGHRAAGITVPGFADATPRHSRSAPSSGRALISARRLSIAAHTFRAFLPTAARICVPSVAVMPSTTPAKCVCPASSIPNI